MDVRQKYQVLERIFSLCERIGVATAVAIGGVAMGHYWQLAGLPLPVLVSVVGAAMIVGAFCLMAGASAMFAIDMFDAQAGFVKRFVVAMPIGLVTVLYSLGVVIAGVHSVVR